MISLLACEGEGESDGTALSFHEGTGSYVQRACFMAKFIVQYLVFYAGRCHGASLRN